MKRSLAAEIGDAVLLVPGNVKRVFVDSGKLPGVAAVREGELGETFDRGIAALWGMDRFVWMQDVPSVLRWWAGAVILAASAALAERVYCSVLCPLGTLQDL